MMGPRNVRRLLLLSLLAGVAVPVHSYDRTAAYKYAKDWYNTDLSDDNLVDHINTPSYTWYYKPKIRLFGVDIFIGTASNDGDNTIPRGQGMDCANFVSQVIKAGGISVPGDGGKGGT